MVNVEDIKVIFLDVDGVLNSQEYWDGAFAKLGIKDVSQCQE